MLFRWDDDRWRWTGEGNSNEVEWKAAEQQSWPFWASAQRERGSNNKNAIFPVCPNGRTVRAGAGGSREPHKIFVNEAVNAENVNQLLKRSPVADKFCGLHFSRWYIFVPCSTDCEWSQLTDNEAIASPPRLLLSIIASALHIFHFVGFSFRPLYSLNYGNSWPRVVRELFLRRVRENVLPFPNCFHRALIL